MARIAYTVTAVLPDPPTLEEYLIWLAGGHVQAVIEGGADSAEIIRVTDPPAPYRVQTRYIFATSESFQDYLTRVAPALRADGVARFGGRAQFERSSGQVVWPTDGR
jgi:hypothetical protein